MSNIVGSLVVNLQANTAALTKGLTNSANQVKSWSASVSRAVGSARKVINSSQFKWAAFGATGAITGGLALSVKLARTQVEAEKKLEAVLNATGHAAGFSAEQLKTMAGELQRVTNFGDETTISAMAVLATFKEVKGDQFKEAMKSAQDMSSVLGTDLQSSVLQIGKALQDPTKGLTALSRAGVSFTESQKDMIKSLQASGDLLGAQRMILAELKGEFGGAAEAMADPWIQAQNALGDLAENVGAELIPYLKIAADEAKRFFDSFASTDADGGKISGIANAFGTVADVIEVVTIAIEALWGAMQDAIGQMLSLMLKIPGMETMLGKEGFEGAQAIAQSYVDSSAGHIGNVKKRWMGPSASERAANLKERERRRKTELENKVAEARADAEDEQVGRAAIQWEKFKRQLPDFGAFGAQGMKQDMMSGAFGLGKMLGGALSGEGLGGATRFATGKGLAEMLLSEDDKKKLKEEGKSLTESMMTPMEQFNAEMSRNLYLLEKGFINQQTFDRAAAEGARNIASQVPQYATTALAGSQEAYRAITGAKFNTQEQMAADIKKQAIDAAKTATNTGKMADKLDDLETVT